MKQGLIAGKSSLSKKQMTLPRLELVATQIVTNLAGNRTSLPNHNIRDVHGWSDSIVVLNQLESNEDYKQFVHNSIIHKLEVRNQLEIS